MNSITMTPQHVLAVCLGNICRSPMAEGLLRHHIQRSGLRIKVDSAGTSGHHTGEHPDRRSISEMKRHGLDISNQRSRQFTKKDFDRFDVILVMDRANFDDVKAMAAGRQDWQNKVHLMVKDQEVPDPYYGGNDGFAHVHRMVDEAAETWVARWKTGVSY